MAWDTLPKWSVAMILGVGGAIVVIASVSYQPPPETGSRADASRPAPPSPPAPLHRIPAFSAEYPSASPDVDVASDAPRTVAFHPADLPAPQVATAPASDESIEASTAPAEPGTPGGKSSPVNTTARAALALVGSDPDAEDVWLDAINDPSLPAAERKDLIEDLNEDGFPDPENLTKDDLPLIESRMKLIEQIAPDAMDDVNADAFVEAYKDLVNMRERLVSD